jgi:hypothetical protein
MPHRIAYILHAINHFWATHHNEILNYGLPTVVSGAALGIEHYNPQDEVFTTIFGHTITWNEFSHISVAFAFSFTLFKVLREVYKFYLRKNAK